jgi:hypothetical protein
MGIKVKLLEKQESSLARILRVEARGVAFSTPNYAVSLNSLDNKYLSSEQLKGVVELPVEFKLSKIGRIIGSSELRDERANRYRSLQRRVPENQVLVSVPILARDKQDIGEIEKPLLKEYIQQLVEILVSPRVNIVCTPIFHKLPEKIYVEIINDFIEHASLLDVAVAPSIPYASRAVHSELVKLYQRTLNKSSNFSLNFICVDFNGSNAINKYPHYNYVLALSKTIEKEHGEPVLLYGVNVKFGKAAPKYSEFPARDLVSYFVGVDLIGANHKKLILPQEVMDRMSPKADLKILVRQDYSYINIDKLKKDRGIGIPLSEIESLEKSKVGEVIKRYNIREALLEAEHLRNKVFKSNSETHPVKYLLSKKGIINDERTKKIVNKVTQQFVKSKSLEDYIS